MPESTTRLRIANMWTGITGVVTPFQNIPRVLQDAQLPASVIWPGQATYDTDGLGDQEVLETRVYEMVLYMNEALFGTSGQMQSEADPFFDQVRDYFLARPGLELDAEGAVQSESAFNARLLGDGGLTVGPYPLNASGDGAKDYIQVRWRLEVQEIALINFRD